MMLLSGSRQAMNAISLPRIEAVKVVAFTKKCWSGMRRIQQMLLLDIKRRLCLLGFFAREKASRAGFISHPKMIKFHKLPWHLGQLLRPEKRAVGKMFSCQVLIIVQLSTGFIQCPESAVTWSNLVVYSACIISFFHSSLRKKSLKVL